MFDLLGREVATLVNENLKGGSYDVKFDGTNLASGIYYYQIIVTDKKLRTFFDVKKLILLK